MLVLDPILLITVPCSRATHSARRSVSALDGTPRNLNQQHRPDRSGCWLRRRRFRDQNIFVKLVLTILWRARSDQGSPPAFAPPILNGTPIVGVTVPFTKTSVGRANICQRHRPISIFLRGENPAVYGVDETLCVSFAHQNVERSEDGSESDTPHTLHHLVDKRQHSTTASSCFTRTGQRFRLARTDTRRDARRQLPALLL